MEKSKHILKAGAAFDALGMVCFDSKSISQSQFLPINLDYNNFF